jgi:hypothetical protein
MPQVIRIVPDEGHGTRSVGSSTEFRKCLFIKQMRQLTSGNSRPYMFMRTLYSQLLLKGRWLCRQQTVASF